VARFQRADDEALHGKCRAWRQDVTDGVSCASSELRPSVLMMQTAQPWQCRNGADSERAGNPIRLDSVTNAF